MAGENGFILDVFYRDASGGEHSFLLDANCSSMKWKLFDARLNLVLSGRHGPPGIDVPPSLGAITGTAFWLDGQAAICFALREFMTMPFYPSKYRPGNNGTGAFVAPPSAYSLSGNDLRWVVGTATGMG